MITFRFYLVTLVAIFLAVALGVTIGSTFLEPALVQDLNNQVESVRQNLDERVARIDELSGEIDDLEAFAEQAAPFAVDGQLDGSVVLVAAQQGVDRDTVERLVGRLRQAGATTDGILWLQPEMGRTDDASDVLADLGIDDVAADDAAAVRAAAWSAVLTEAATTVEESGGTTTTTVTNPTTTTTSTSTTEPTTDGTATSVPTEPTTTTTLPTTTSTPSPPLFEQESIGVLDEAGWVRLQEIEAGEPAAPPAPPAGPPPFAVVIITGPEADGEDGTGPVMDFVRENAAQGVATVVAEAWADQGDDGSARGTSVRPIRDDAELAALISTVDDLDLIQGQVATALALSDLGRGIAGHYGYGDGADLVLPPWLGP